MWKRAGRVPGTAACFIGLAVAALGGGCSSGGGGDSSATGGAGSGATRVTTGDFRSASGGEGGNATESRAPARPSVPLVVSAGPKPDDLKDVAVIAGDPVNVIKPEAQATAGSVTIDALVGQINGKPIYADKFLSPLDARLRADRAQSRTREAFLRTARDVMYDRLQAILIDELLTAEARAQLTPEQRQGLFYFVNQVRDNLASRYGGSREVAEQTLREREGRGFEAQVQEEKKLTLQRMVLSRNVDPRVNVSWRDVLRAYEKEYLEKLGDSVALVRMIIIEASNAEAVQGVVDGLASGKPFVEVANVGANILPKGEEGVFKWSFKGDFATAKLVEDAVLNEKVHTLDPERAPQVVGPFDYRFGGRRDTKVWMCLEGVQRPKPAPLEDVQLKLYYDLAARRRVDEQTRFFQGLIERASFSPLVEMLERLVPIAVERYGVPPAAGAPTTGEGR
ncbi:MAG: hypothetical protein AB7V47_01895 [Phycisphaerales bacterium]